MNKEIDPLPEGYTNNNFNELDYGLFIPPAYNPIKKYPLIIRLHGSMDTKSWNLVWYNEPIISKDPCIVLTPKSYEKHFGWGNSYDDEHSPDMIKTLEVIQNIKNDFSIDNSRIYIHGASMGGYGVFSLLAKEPEMFAAAVAICGGGDPSLARYYMKTPLWIFHGEDDPVINVEQSRNIYKTIIKNGGERLRYTEYKGVKHDSWVNAWNEKTLVPWILAQEKEKVIDKPNPVENLILRKDAKNVIELKWDIPQQNNKNIENIWYYIVEQNDDKIAELEVTSFKIALKKLNEKAVFSVIAVDYQFQKSEKRSISLKDILPLNA